MILVDIQVHMLDRTYDFELDEDADIKSVTEDIIALITEQEQFTCKEMESMCLYALEQGMILRSDKSAKQQGVRAGDRLILF